MGSAFRDRTAEFHSVSQTLKKIGAIPSINQNEDDPASSKRSPPESTGSEFNKKATRIKLHIQETSQKIARLAKCTVWNLDLLSTSSYLFFAGINDFILDFFLAAENKKREKCSVFDPDSGIRLCDFWIPNEIKT